MVEQDCPGTYNDPIHRDPRIAGDQDDMGRQIGAYPILIGVNYHIPLESMSDIISQVTEA